MFLRLSSPPSRHSPEPDAGALALAGLVVLAEELGRLRPEPICCFLLLFVGFRAFGAFGAFGGLFAALRRFGDFTFLFF